MATFIASMLWLCDRPSDLFLPFWPDANNEKMTVMASPSISSAVPAFMGGLAYSQFYLGHRQRRWVIDYQKIVKGKLPIDRLKSELVKFSIQKQLIKPMNFGLINNFISNLMDLSLILASWIYWAQMIIPSYKSIHH